MATPPELAVLFQNALQAALTKLRAIVEGRDRRAALEALTLPERHLNDPRTIQMTRALGTEDAALLHLDAIKWRATTRASLTIPGGSTH
jgi:hypothetical protein